MIGVTNDLLDAEALRRGRLRVRPAASDVREVLRQCMPRGTPDSPVVLGVAAEVPHEVVLDPLRLRQVRRRVSVSVTCGPSIVSCDSVWVRVCVFSVN